MKVVISCDEVFDVLTRGPFPTGKAEDEFVDAHLAACHDCRRLAEALRPAVDLFQESILENERQPLPVYLGRFHTASPQVDVKPRRMQTGSNSQLTGVSLVALLGIVALFVVTCQGLFSDSDVTPATAASTSRDSSNLGETIQIDEPLLASFGLPLSCFGGKRASHTPIENVVVAENADHSPLGKSLVCCTRCHHAGGTTFHSDRGLRVVTAACVACHKKAERPEVSTARNSVAGLRVS